jgi:hypothetical protein
VHLYSRFLFDEFSATLALSPKRQPPLTEIAKHLAIDIAPVTNVKDSHDSPLVVYLIDHAVSTYPDAPSLAPC